jgi:hypothetical protein
MIPAHSGKRSGFGAMPPFRPDSSEDSLFLPRYGHVERSLSHPGTGKLGRCRMIIRASGRSALIGTAGLLVLLASPVTAATNSDDSAPDSRSGSTVSAVTHRTYRHAYHHRRHDVHRKSHAIAGKANDKAEDAGKAVIADAAPGDNKVLSNIPPSIANANAQMLLAGVQLSAAAAIPSGSDVPTGAVDSQTNAKSDSGALMAAADQLNDADKTLQETTAAPAPAATSSSQAAPGSTPPATAAVTMTSESSTWNQTSLIGKIFIGFGALLTMASAARMFIG